MCVTKDLGPSQRLAQIMLAALARGHEIYCIAEGLGAGHFEKSGLPLEFKGSRDFQQIPFSLDEFACLEAHKPDVLLTGLSGPIHLEQDFALAASLLGIPVAFDGDFWGCEVRSTANPDLFLALDEFAVRQAKAHYRIDGITYRVVGNHGIIDPMPELGPDVQDVRRILREQGTIISYIGGGEESTEEIKLLKASLSKMKEPFLLVVRYHPKHARQTSHDGRPFEQVWDELLSDFADRMCKLPKLSANETVMISDLVASGYSTLMTVAACARVKSIALESDATMASLKKETGLDEVPMVALGHALALREPQGLSELDFENLSRTPLFPFQPEAALDAIEELVKG